MLGVTMQESGVSKIIAVRLADNGDVVEKGDGDNSVLELDEEPAAEMNEAAGEEEEVSDGLFNREGS